MISSIDKKTALVLIDLQNSIVQGEKAHPVADVLLKVAALISAFRNAELPVVIVNVNPMGAAWTKARVEKPAVPQNPVVQAVAKLTMPITGALDIVPEVMTEPTDIFVTKQTWNAFYGTELNQRLKGLEITGIVLGGISTSIGVEGTVRAASELGYNISFATDAMTDKILAAHENSLSYIFPRMGELGCVAEIIEKLPSSQEL